MVILSWNVDSHPKDPSGRQDGILKLDIML
jgi:hypothetical protein